MAHNLEKRADGRYSFVGLRDPAWHNLGKILEAPISDADWMKEAGLDFQIEKMPLYRKDMETVPSHFAIVRTDNQKTLGVVSKAYEPVQNIALMEWLRGLDGYADVTIETAGVLGQGETVFISARCNGLKFNIGGDEHRGYMLLTNGHIGNRRLTAGPTITRAVCENTVAMATGHMIVDEKKGGFALSGNLSAGFTMRHTKNIADMMADIQQAYARTTDCWKQTEEVMRAMALKPITEEMITELFTKPFAQPKKANKDAEALAKLLDDAPNEAKAEQEEHDESVVATAMAAAREKRLREILAGETCTRYASTRETLFAGFNAVTEYVTHELNVKAGDDDAKGTKRRFETNLLDRGERIKRKAYKLSMELLKV